MKQTPILSNQQQFELSSDQSLPCTFNITLYEVGGKKSECLFKVSGQDTHGAKKTVLYTLADREHHSYLDLFAKLSRDFGLRVPQNRIKTIPISPSFETAYNEILTENIHPDILYGYGDPAVIRVDRNAETIYYLLATSNDAPHSFPMLRSSDLKDWQFVDFIFPEGKKPHWAADGELASDYWAAEMHQIGDEFRIYYVARENENAELCIGMVSSVSPEGPFVSCKEPVLKGNIIDPHIFVQSAEMVYLYWKEDNNDVWPGKLIELLNDRPHLTSILFEREEDRRTASFVQTLWPWIETLPPMERFQAMQVLIEVIISNFASFYTRLSEQMKTEDERSQKQITEVLKYMKTPMYAQQLSADGQHLVGQPTKILENDLPWEAHLVEGMWVTEHNDTFYLFYAGNDFSTDQYGIGVAVSKSPLGPFTKMHEPFLKSTADWWAPGHPSVVMDMEGKYHMFLHAYFPGKAGYKEFRALLSVPMIFEEDKVRVG